jgi:hypothetical protein
MSVFRLSAVRGEERNAHWALSTIGSMTCWVQAHDEGEARELVTHATVLSHRADHFSDRARPPWKDPRIAECVADDEVSCPEGVLRTRTGQALPIGLR